MLLRLAGWIAAGELPIVLAMAPALLFPTPKRLLVLLVVPLVWASARAATGRFIPSTPLNTALGLLLLMVGVSVYATPDIPFSLGKISGAVLGALLFWSTSRWLTTRQRLAVAISAMLLATAGLSFVGLLGTTDTRKFMGLAMFIARLQMAIHGVPGATYGINPNVVGGCLALLMPLQVSMLAARVDRWLLPSSASRFFRVAAIAAEAMILSLSVFTVILMQSRGAWAGLAIAGAAFVAWHSRPGRILVGAGAALMLVVTITVGPQRVVNAAMLGSGADMPTKVAVRMELWSAALRGIRDFPLTGMGMNGFRKRMPLLYPSPAFAPDVDVVHAHNAFLQTALDLGIPGLVAFLAIWMLVGALLVTVYSTSGDRVLRATAGGLGAGLIAHFVFNMTDAIPIGAKVGALFWFVLALVVGLHRIATNRTAAAQATVPPIRRCEEHHN